MDRYQKTLRRRVIALIAGVALCACLLIVGLANGLLLPNEDKSHFSGFLAGYQLGMLSALSVIFVVLIVRFGRALRDENRIKKLYIQENDERNRLIWAKSGGTVLYICAIAIILAAVVAGYFSPTALFSLLGCGMFLLLVKLGCTAYYRHTL